MTLDHPFCGCRPMATRRRVLIGMGAACALPAVGCAGGEPPIEFVDEATVRQMGLQTWQQIRQETALSDNPRYRETLQRVGTKLLQAANMNPAEWEMRAFAGDQINAFAVPGKKIGVFEGMFELADTEAQLAAVVGHEIAHVLENHAQERTNTSVLRDLGLQVTQAALDVGNIQYAQEIAAIMGLGAQVGITLPYSRAHEREADERGLALMAQAGYDPYAAVELWEKMAQRGGGQIGFLSTHPAAGERAERLRRIVEERYG